MQYTTFAKGSYYEHLWERYFNVAGFFLGAILVTLIYFAGIGENKKISFFRSLAIIALLNSLSGIYGAFNSALGIERMTDKYYHLFNLAANPISGLILALVVYSCYKEELANVFCFGMVTYGITLLMFNVFTDTRAELVLFLLARAVILGLICMWMTKTNYFYTCFIIFISFFLLTKIVGEFVINIAYIDEIGRTSLPELIFDTMRILIPDSIILGLVLTISIVYERAVLTVKDPAAATT
jgi:hypothetical protein